ncbi:hypothetical protein [Actinomadura miaoliensis]|uniref:Uncharacterized protein n=1 Tax=Actinomadura miaoliensis TaxID=430685 RepID=A0ABP7VEX9_9ACTN
MADDEDPIPIGQALAGLEIHGLPEKWTALDAIVLVKCLDSHGEPSWAFRRTKGISDEEMLGALIVRADLARRDILDLFDEDDD